MAHPVRPDAVKIFDNFYSLTVYEKGSEVVRMYECLLGKAGFREYSRRPGLWLPPNHSILRENWQGARDLSVSCR